MIFKFFKRDFPVKKITWKKFLKGFLWKIEAEGKILQGSPLYFGENEGKSNQRESLLKLAFLEIGIECRAVPAIDLLPPCL